MRMSDCRSLFKAMMVVFFMVNHLPEGYASQRMTWIGEVTTSQGVRINAATFDLIQQMLAAEVAVVNANTARALVMLESSDELFCRGNLRQSAERDAKYYRTTTPQVIFPSLHLYSNVPIAKNPVSLDDLSQQALVLPLQYKRDYGIDVSVLRNSALKIVDLYSYAKASNAIALFDRGRADLLIEYPSVYQALSTRADDNKAYVYPIEETEAYSPGFIYCSKSAAGEKMIAELDRVLTELSQRQAYFDVHKNWFKNFDITPLYNTVYKTTFAQ